MHNSCKCSRCIYKSNYRTRSVCQQHLAKICYTGCADYTHLDMLSSLILFKKWWLANILTLNTQNFNIACSPPFTDCNFTPTYLSLQQVIVQHQHLMITPKPDYRYSLLSNDNGFLNFYPYFFEQRTLNARFQMNNTKPKSVQLIKKPVLAVMGLLSKLGDHLVFVEDLKQTEHEDIGILATTETTDGRYFLPDLFLHFEVFFIFG